MSVVKSKREQSQFEVYHHYYQLRHEVTEFLLFDYGYSPEKARKRLEKQFSGRPYEELDDDEKERYGRMNKRNEAFFQWFMKDERAAIINDLRELGRCLFSANNIYPHGVEFHARYNDDSKEYHDWIHSWIKSQRKYLSNAQYANTKRMEVLSWQHTK